MWPWRRRVAEAEQRLADADEKTAGTAKLVQQYRAADTALRYEAVGRNHWTELLLQAMRGR